MPLYEYECEVCQIKFEVLKPIAERAKAQCPGCGQLADKVMSVNYHTFGWRLTDASHEPFGPRDEMERDV